MIRASHGLEYISSCAHFFQRFQPDIEDLLGASVVLRKPPVDRARSIVDVEVDIHLVASCPVFLARQMLRYPRSRTKEALLFTTPQRYANGPPGPQTGCLQNSHRLDDRG